MRDEKSEEREPEFATGLRHARDHRGGHVAVELAHGEIVEEEQWPRTLDKDVVDTVGDKIVPHAVVSTRREGYLELGPDPVGAGYEYRLAITLGI